MKISLPQGGELLSVSWSVHPQCPVFLFAILITHVFVCRKLQCPASSIKSGIVLSGSSLYSWLSRRSHRDWEFRKFTYILLWTLILNTRCFQINVQDYFFLDKNLKDQIFYFITQNSVHEHLFNYFTILIYSQYTEIYLAMYKALADLQIN